MHEQNNDDNIHKKVMPNKSDRWINEYYRKYNVIVIDIMEHNITTLCLIDLGIT